MWRDSPHISGLLLYTDLTSIIWPVKPAQASLGCFSQARDFHRHFTPALLVTSTSAHDPGNLFYCARSADAHNAFALDAWNFPRLVSRVSLTSQSTPPTKIPKSIRALILQKIPVFYIQEYGTQDAHLALESRMKEKKKIFPDCMAEFCPALLRQEQKY